MDILKWYKENGASTSFLEKKLAEKGMGTIDESAPSSAPPKPDTDSETEDDQAGNFSSGKGKDMNTPQCKTKEVIIEGRLVKIPVLSENPKGVRNKAMCPVCARQKKKDYKCTGPIPICDQCTKRGLDAEMCTSKESIKDIQERRKREMDEYEGRDIVGQEDMKEDPDDVEEIQTHQKDQGAMET